MASFTSHTILPLASAAAAKHKSGLSRHRYICIYERPCSGARGETTLSWEFVDSKAKHDPAFLVSFDELGFDDSFAETYCKEAEKTDKSSRLLMGLERMVGTRVYQRVQEAKAKKTA